MKRIFLSIVLILLFVTYLLGQFHGSRVYNGIQSKKKHYSWCLYACMEMYPKSMFPQCYFATQYARLYNNGWGVDCCNLYMDDEEIRTCIDMGGPYFDEVLEFLNFNLNDKFRSIDRLDGFFKPSSNYTSCFPFFLIAEDGHAVLLYGIDLGEVSNLLYYVDPNTGVAGGHYIGRDLTGLYIVDIKI